MDEEAHGQVLSRPLKFLDWINPCGNRRHDAIPEKRQTCPEYKAGFFSLLTFSWMSSLMATGYRRPLELNDIWLINPNRSTHKLAAQLKASITENQLKNANRPLLVSIWQNFRRDIVIGGVAAFALSCAQVVMPLVIKYIISYAVKSYYASSLGVAAPPIGEGIGLVLCLTVLQIIASIGSNQFFYRGMIVGGQVRSALISVIFDKAMTISGRAKAGGSKEIQETSFTAEAREEKENKLPHAELPKAEENSKQESKKGGKDETVEDTSGWANGRIVNLMSVDTYRVDQACGFAHLVWTSPLSLIVTIVLLLLNLTYSALVGIGLFLLSFPVIIMGMIIMFRRRKVINKITDERVTITQEVLSAIRFIKYFAWEADFLKQLQHIRQREISVIRWLFGTRSAINTFGNTTPIFASMLSFITYSVTSHTFDPAPVFASLALFNQLRSPLLILPMILGMVADGLQSITRIEQFLLSEDGETESGNTKDPREEPGVKPGYPIVIRQASFTWEQSSPPDPDERLRLTDISGEEMRDAKFDAKGKEKEMKKKQKQAEKERKQALKERREPPVEIEERTMPLVHTQTPFALHNINLEIGSSEFICVIGGVGSGKSSLLSAIAGQMRRTAGQSTVDSKRAFCSQIPWIRNATIRENITFGQEFEQHKYNQVIEACSLTHDLEMLPHGDLSEIGERGINLSGGQKHRVSLARAIYFDADVVLLDDPVSAVDAYVGMNIMEHAICGLLRHKCRILSTHQLHVLRRCDRIIMMENGKILAFDTFDSLVHHNEDFKRMIATVNTSEPTGTQESQEKLDLAKNQSEKVADLPQDVLMQEEERQVRSISWPVYREYGRATGSLLIPPFVLLTLVLAQGTNIITNLWLAWWSEDRFGLNTGEYIGTYASLGVLQALFLLISTLAFAVFGTEASKRMLHQATKRLLHAPVSFFDTTPLGRIMNRFSKDIDVMDNNLTESMRMAGTTMTMLLAIIALIISYYYYFALALILILMIYGFSSVYYRASARELKRHEAVLRSAVFTRFSEALSGSSTLKAYGVIGDFSHQLRDAIDDMDSAYYLTFANQRWLGVRLDIIGVIFIFITGMLVVTNKFSVSPSISGLILSYLVSITQLLQFSVRQTADVENNMNATERIYYYAHELPQEASEEARPHILPENWPSKGEIVFQNLQLHYHPGLPLVLHGLSLHIQPGEKLGIVGRTGAGKSSIMAALFRIVEPSGGSITIDGVDTSSIGLHDLRSCMSFIPQDATLIRGTVRSNLDPFNQYSDAHLWEALLKTGVVQQEQENSENRITLETHVESEGANFSLGQRQLIALARALVRNSQIVVADEATSSVDFESDAQIQRTILHGFRGKTLLCIAHRLKTIIAYDRICVVEDGRVVEIDTPLALYDAGGRFKQMCDQSHIEKEEIANAQDSARGE